MQTRQTILVVDDAPANLTVFNSLLKDEFRILVATNGARALELARSENPPDLILLDVLMPVMDGYEVCRRLKGNPSTQSIPVLFVTGQSSLESDALAIQSGGADLITNRSVQPCYGVEFRPIWSWLNSKWVCNAFSKSY